MKKAVIMGYASMDYVLILDGYIKADHTTLIRRRAKDALPRPGGSPLYVGRCLAQAGMETALITWVGDDALGEVFQSCLTDNGIDGAGVAVVSPARTPVCFLIYQADGSCCYCFDPGFMGKEALTAQQAALIKQAELLCITVGPPDISRQALGLAGTHVQDNQVDDQMDSQINNRADHQLAWVAKNDPVSYPPELRALLGKRADYIFCNAHERQWVDAALAGRERPPPLLIQTNGAGGVTAQQGNRTSKLSVHVLPCNDACGAGDTLAGGSLAAVMNGESGGIAVAKAGIAAAAALLQQRA